MPSQSKSQQRLMGQAYAYKKGELKSSEVSAEIKELADNMTLKQLKDFASTKHDGLPEVVEEGVIKVDLKRMLSKISGAIGWKHDPKMRQELLTAFEEDLRIIMAKHNYLVEDIIPENITPANLTGMGPVVLPANGTLGSGDVPAGQGDAEEEYKKSKKRNKKMKEIYTSFESFINESTVAEANRGKVHKAAKQGSYPAVIVVVQDGKVIHQEPVSSPEVAPATFNVMQKEYPKAILHLEDKTGKRLFSESVVNEMDSEGIQSLADELSAEVYTARLKDGAKSATIKATTTTKTWDDGAPVLKFLARGKAKDMPFTLYQRPFTVLHDVAHGWFYFTDGRKWYGLHGDEGYSEPEDLPFDMEISESVVTEALSTAQKKRLGEYLDNLEFDDLWEISDFVGKQETEIGLEDLPEWKKIQNTKSIKKLRQFAFDYMLKNNLTVKDLKEAGILESVVSEATDINDPVLIRMRQAQKHANDMKKLDAMKKEAEKEARRNRPRWTQKKYDKWLETVASNGGAENAFDMAKNAEFEPGLIDWVRKQFRGDDPLQRIQWDIEAFA